VKPLAEQDPWEVLGVPRGASEEEVRRAYERLSAALAPGSLALYSLADVAEQRGLEEQLRAAYLTLMRAFGWDVPAIPGLQTPGAEGAPEPPTPAAPPPTAPVPAEPALSPDTEFTGAVLRKVREAMGLGLAEVAQRTRIRTRQLESIEAERFEALPERVFVRGFVMAVARELHLDPERVWASYGKRWEGSARRG
jgi:flagellar biosynthesis protein FlhG